MKVPDYWLMGRAQYYERHGFDPQAAIQCAIGDWEEQERRECEHRHGRQETIVVALGAGVEAGKHLHCEQANGEIYTLEVLSVKRQEPNAWHPQGIEWHTCLRTHGMHV